MDYPAAFGQWWMKLAEKDRETKREREIKRERSIVVDKRSFITRSYAQVTLDLIHNATAGDPHIAIPVKTVCIMVLCSKNQPSA